MIITSLVMAIMQVDIVISTLGHHDMAYKDIANQMNIISAIKEVGTVKVDVSFPHLYLRVNILFICLSNTNSPLNIFFNYFISSII